MREIKLPNNIKDILKILNNEGKGYIVGGYIRDILLGLEPKDCDFCTDIPYERLKEIFSNWNPIEIGKSFGIIQIEFKNKKYEIAKLRVEKRFTDNRKEVDVEFINDIYLDLKRRDFTVNGIAYDGEKFYTANEFSFKDIKDKKLRFIGNGERRVEEDPLRALRGIRFAVTKNLELLPETLKSLEYGKKFIERLSIERIQDELFKILEDRNSSKGIKYLFDTGILNEIFPSFNDIERCCEGLDKLKNESEVKLFYFLSFSPENIEKLKISKKLKSNIITVINYLNFLQNLNNRIEIKKVLGKIGIENLNILIKIWDIDNNIENLKKELNDILSSKEPIKLQDLKINGKDILKFFDKKGIIIGKVLDKLLELVIENPELNDKEKLLKIVEDEITSGNNN